MGAWRTVPKLGAAPTSPSYRWRLRPSNRWIIAKSAGTSVEPVEPQGSERGRRRAGFPSCFSRPEEPTMTLLDRPQIARLGVEGVALLETARLVLRRPRLEDAKPVAALVGDRRIAENTARIPHPYGIDDARQWIGVAMSQPATFAITIGG